MVERVRSKREEESGGNYFASRKENIEFISSGCKTLDLALGGGWAEGRVANIVGDKSTGKTLLCIEAAANFVQKYPKGRARYAEAEAAFDQDYAGALGMPLDNIDFGEAPMETVEDFFEDLSEYAKRAKKENVLYILDSLDALSDREEMKRDMDKGTYGAAKAKILSELFRRKVREVEDSGLTLIVVSQIRDKMNPMPYERKWTRSGGRALDFYATHVVELAQMKRLKRTAQKVERVVGIEVKAAVSKNKVGLPFRDATFPIMFGYGIDDEIACEKWLESTGAPVPDGSMRDLHEAVEKRWYEIEKRFLPTKRKYGGEQ
jgi:recombination protein RecA